MPELVVEIISPGDTAAEIHEKVPEYLEPGRGRYISRQRQVIVYYPSGDARILREDDVLEGEDVVPGFSLPLVKLWSRDPGRIALEAFSVVEKIMKTKRGNSPGRAPARAAARRVLPHS